MLNLVAPQENPPSYQKCEHCGGMHVDLPKIWKIAVLAQITATVFKHLTEACSYDDSMTILFLDSALREVEKCAARLGCTPAPLCPTVLWQHTACGHASSCARAVPKEERWGYTQHISLPLY